MSTVNQGDQRIRDFGSSTETTETQVVRENRAEVPSEKRGRQEETREVKQEVKQAEEVVAGGTLAEAAAGVGAIVLAIIGLAGFIPGYMFTIGTIVLGAGLFIAAASVASKYLTLLQDTEGGRTAGAELRGGAGAGLLGGLAGVILGILGLIGLTPTTLCAIAMIAIGAGLLASTFSTMRLNRLIVQRPVAHSNLHFLAHELSSISTALQAIAGTAGIVLGIIALVSTLSATLVMVSLICMGASLFLSGSALSARMLVSAVG